MEEIWKDVVGYEEYYLVSSTGIVRSKGRWVYKLKGKPYYKNPRLMSVCISNGYKSVSLTKNNKTTLRSVHSIVAEAYLNHIVCKFSIVVDHIDSDKLNNNVSNLRLITSRHNSSLGHKNKTSKYTNICWHKINKKWMVSINKKFLGYFNCELSAYIFILNYEKKNKDLQKLPR